MKIENIGVVFPVKGLVTSYQSYGEHWVDAANLLFGKENVRQFTGNAQRNLNWKDICKNETDFLMFIENLPQWFELGTRESIAAIRVPKVLYCWDSHLNYFTYLQSLMNHFDKIFMASKVDAERLGAEWLPPAYNELLHRPLGIMKKWEIGFIGQQDNVIRRYPRMMTRHEALCVLQEKYPRSSFIGQGYYGEDYVRLMNECRYMFDFPTGAGIGTRFYEALGMNIPIISSFSFEEREYTKADYPTNAIITIHGQREWFGRSLVRAVLDLARIDEIVEQQMDFCKKHRPTYKHRLEDIVNKLEMEFPKNRTMVSVPACEDCVVGVDTASGEDESVETEMVASSQQMKGSTLKGSVLKGKSLGVVIPTIFAIPTINTLIGHLLRIMTRLEMDIKVCVVGPSGADHANSVSDEFASSYIPHGDPHSGGVDGRVIYRSCVRNGELVEDFTSKVNTGLEMEAIRKSDFILICNDDVVMAKDALENMLNTLESYEFDLVGPISNCDYSWQHSHRTGFSGKSQFEIGMDYVDEAFEQHIMSLNTEDMLPPEARGLGTEKRDWIAGYFMLLRRDVLDCYGSLDESMKMVHSDQEYCERLPKDRIGYCMDAFVFHYGAVTRKLVEKIDKDAYQGVDCKDGLCAIEQRERKTRLVPKRDSTRIIFYAGCFTGDTKIRLLSGKSVSLKWLCENYSEGKFYTYSYSRKRKKIVVGEIKNPRITRRHAQLVRVILDSGKSIRCTPDHRFLLRSGVYRQAQFLRKGDSLMPLRTKISTDEDILSGYRQIYDVTRKEWSFVHRMVYGGMRKSGYLIHHKNFNKLDNNPNNLRYMTRSKHTKLHLKAGHQSMKYLMKYSRSKQGRKKSAEIGRKVLTRLWKQDDFRKKMIGILKGVWDNEEFVRAHSRRTSKRNKESWQNSAYRKFMLSVIHDKVVESTKRKWSGDAEYRALMSKVVSKSNKKRWEDPTYRRKMLACLKRGREKQKKKVCLNNHKVEGVVRLKKKEDVYDIEIPEYHNFALSSGVFVHNSSWEQWSVKNLIDGGIGGSESCQLYLARELALLGYKVGMYYDWDRRPCTFAREFHYGEFDIDKINDESKKISTVIIYVRQPDRMLQDIYRLESGNVLREAKMILWNHDVAYGDTEYSRLEQADAIVNLSAWHKDYWGSDCGVSHKRIKVIGDGINSCHLKNGKRFVDSEWEREELNSKRPMRLIYASSYDRGLDILLEILKKVDFPWELNVYYGSHNLERAIEFYTRDLSGIRSCELGRWYDALREKINVINGRSGESDKCKIKVYGRVAEKELLEAFGNSDVFMYPTYFHETFCITALYAQVSGCHIISRPLAALRTTLGSRANLIDGDVYDVSVQERYKLALEHLYSTGAYLQPVPVEESRNYLEQHVWENIVKKWDYLIGELIEPRERIVI